jgi:transposase
LVEACWSTVRQPGPIAGFYQRVRARRGHSIAIVASARKLACLFWCLLARGEDYAFAQPSLTTKKMRRLELQAGAPRRQGGQGVWATNDAMRHAERELALQAQRAYERTVKDRQQKQGRERDSGPRIKWLPEGAGRAADPKAQLCALTRRHSRPAQLSHHRR